MTIAQIPVEEEDRFDSSSLPLVSIVTPSFNQGRFIERTIQSVLAQDYPHIEYIVVDGMSSDETRNVLQKYQTRISRVIHEPDAGQSHALNKGFQTANGTVLAWLNSDDCYSSALAVSQAVSCLSKQGCDLVYGRRRYIDAAGYQIPKIRPFRKFSLEALKQWDYIPQECCFWTKQAYGQAGGFLDEAYEIAMDYELWLRMLKSGARFQAVNRFFGLYRLHAEAKSASKWQSTGLDEVASIQKKYCEGTLSPLEMHVASVDYYTGFRLSRIPVLKDIGSLAWSLLEKSQYVMSNGAPLDAWTYATGNGSS